MKGIFKAMSGTLLRNLTWLALAGALVGLAGCSDECKSAKNCGEGEVCLEGKCMESKIEPPDTDSGTGTGADSDTDTDTDADSDSDTDADTDTDTDTDGDTDTDTDSDTDGDTDTFPDKCENPKQDCPTPDNSCSEYECVLEACSLVYLDGDSCEGDGKECNEYECISGTCTEFPLSSVDCTDDDNDCTRDICQAGVCEHLPHRSGEPCEDDGNPCTQDVCDNGDCGLALNGVTCDGDDNPCTSQICETGVCTAYPLVDNTDCDDGSWCNGTADKCSSGVCLPPEGSEPCVVTEDCRAAACDEPDAGASVGYCGVDLLDSTSCDDGFHCNGPDSCVTGDCVHGPAPCGAGSTDCSMEICIESPPGCSFQDVADGDPCINQDGGLCDGVERCDDGKCETGSPFCPVLSDCLDVACYENGGDPYCADAGIPVNEGDPCSESHPCLGTGTRLCVAGVCAHGENPACAPREQDGDLCTRYLLCTDNEGSPDCQGELDELPPIIEVGCGETVDFSTAGTNNEVQTYWAPCNVNLSGGEVVVGVTEGEGTDYTATITTTASTLGEDLHMVLITDPCDAANTCAQTSQTSFSATVPASPAGPFIVIDGANFNRGEGTVQITCP